MSSRDRRLTHPQPARSHGHRNFVQRTGPIGIQPLDPCQVRREKLRRHDVGNRRVQVLRSFGGGTLDGKLDQLAALHYLESESLSEASAVSDARRAEQIAMQRYKAGLVGYLDVVYAQQSVLTNEQTAAQIGGQRLVASVVLIKALGGGWAGRNTP